MKGLRKYLKIFLALSLVIGFSSSAFGKSSKRRRGRVKASLNDAVKRSESQQERIKVRFDDEIADQIDGWKDTNRNMVDLDNNKKNRRKRKRRRRSTLKAVDIGKPDYSYEESGEDQSGLNDIRSEIVEEPTDIDFDEELREVSSLKD